MKQSLLLFISSAVALSGLLNVRCHAAAGHIGSGISLPAYRVEADGFGAQEADIRAVLDSVGRELWQFFPDSQQPPFSRPPVLPNGPFKGLPQKADSSQ